MSKSEVTFLTFIDIRNKEFFKRVNRNLKKRFINVGTTSLLPTCKSDTAKKHYHLSKKQGFFILIATDTQTS